MPTRTIDPAELARAEKAANAGAKYLDRKLPGWEFDVNLRSLDLASSDDCVLGQLGTDIVPRAKWFKPSTWTGRISKPEYWDAVAHLRLKHATTAKYGFTSSGSLHDGTAIGMDALNVAWRKVIRTRLKGYRNGS